MRPLITTADLAQIASNSELDIAQDTLITPLAREEAERRGIRFPVKLAPDADVRMYDPDARLCPGSTTAYRLSQKWGQVQKE